jgi:hypothetical protein
MSRLALCGVLLGAAMACSTPRPPPMPEYIGQAQMAADGTLTLDLESVECDGSRAMGRIVIQPSDPRYRATLDHIGEIRPGETRPVRPWPAEPCR